MLNKAEELCRQNPNLQSSLFVSLLKAEVEKTTSPKWSNAKTYVIVLNFICLIGTYDKKQPRLCLQILVGLRTGG